MAEQNANIAELEELAATLTSVVMNEANPKNWPGGVKPVQDLTRDEQSARVTIKKSATLSVGLLTKVTDLLNATRDPKNPTTAAALKASDDAELAASIKEAEKKAAEIMARLGVSH